MTILNIKLLTNYLWETFCHLQIEHISLMEIYLHEKYCPLISYYKYQINNAQNGKNELLLLIGKSSKRGE